MAVLFADPFGTFLQFQQAVVPIRPSQPEVGAPAMAGGPRSKRPASAD